MLCAQTLFTLSSLYRVSSMASVPPKAAEDGLRVKTGVIVKE